MQSDQGRQGNPRKHKRVRHRTLWYKYRKSDGFKSYSLRPGKPGEGYVLVTPLERYSRKQLSILQGRVRDHADIIHHLLDAGDVTNLIELIKGEMSEVMIRGLQHAYAPVPAIQTSAA